MSTTVIERALNRAMTEEGNCYEIASLLHQLMGHGELVHGQPTGQGPIEGIKHGHAWVEIGGVVIDASRDGVKRAFLRDAYYKLGKINADECKRYSCAEAAERLVRCKHYGPWEEGDNADEPES